MAEESIAQPYPRQGTVSDNDPDYNGLTTTRTRSSRSVEQTDPLDLPYRQVTHDANMEEFTTETREGQIVKPVRSHETGQMEDWKLVTFLENDPENPKNWSKLFKWYITMVVAWTCFVVALCSSIITADFPGVQNTFHVSHEVALITLTVFVVGFGVGKFARWRLVAYRCVPKLLIIRSFRSNGVRSYV